MLEKSLNNTYIPVGNIILRLKKKKRETQEKCHPENYSSRETTDIRKS